jgi:hypothetical protein
MAQSIAYLLSEKARLQADIERINAQLDYAKTNSNPAIVSGLEQRLASSQDLLDVVNEQLQLAQADVSSPKTSAGEIVSEGQPNIVANPAQPASVLTTDGRINPDNIETGTDAPTRTIEQTQSTPPNSSIPFAANDEEGNPLPSTPSLNAGVGAPRDDNTSPNTNTTQQMINASFSQRISPEPNVLDDYASYTYSISWYLLTPTQYNQMTTTQKTNISGWQLLMQSGGAPTGVANSGLAGRNQYFDLDYYIDDLEIDTYVPLKGTGSPSGAADIKFKVTEPNGISLVTNLYKAVSNLYKQVNVSKDANYPMAQYCLIIRFYGYDENGNLVTTGRRGTGGSTNLTDPRAIVEKFYPFVITNITFRVANKIIEYSVSGKPLPYFYNKSQDRGTIPFAFELMGETVSQILVGKPVGTQYPADDGRAVSPNPPAKNSTTSPGVVSNSASPQQVAAAAATGTDPNAATDTGMAFGVGGLSG